MEKQTQDMLVLKTWTAGVMATGHCPAQQTKFDPELKMYENCERALCLA